MTSLHLSTFSCTAPHGHELLSALSSVSPPPSRQSPPEGGNEKPIHGQPGEPQSTRRHSGSQPKHRGVCRPGLYHSWPLWPREAGSFSLRKTAKIPTGQGLAQPALFSQTSQRSQGATRPSRLPEPPHCDLDTGPPSPKSQGAQGGEVARVSPASWGRVWSLVSTIGLLFRVPERPHFPGSPGRRTRASGVIVDSTL